MKKSIALIPARSGSQRIKDKNIRFLGGHPILAYSIRSAIDSGVFDAVICATDSEEYAKIARYYGAEVPMLRSTSISGAKSPDIEWVEWILDFMNKHERAYDIFSILRPTSPFRKAETIQRAMKQFLAQPEVHSLRAVEKCSQHPGKMWVVRGAYMTPLMPLSPSEQPWHSSQYAALPDVYVQNASLEIAWTRVVFEQHSIAGNVLCPFITTEEEGLDVNNEFDWWRAERLLELDLATLPEIKIKPIIL
ncbi:acylneuraminate cytidylyltransferase family protein [Pedobacter sp. P351]|uniref:acylneuraminate cytidylyltransferase family protein n=1 Tax=Pedobacter superstes TaxID=3133441 RepID=UPI0030B33621